MNEKYMLLPMAPLGQQGVMSTGITNTETNIMVEVEDMDILKIDIISMVVEGEVHHSILMMSTIMMSMRSVVHHILETEGTTDTTETMMDMRTVKDITTDMVTIDSTMEDIMVLHGDHILEVRCTMNITIPTHPHGGIMEVGTETLITTTVDIILVEKKVLDLSRNMIVQMRKWLRYLDQLRDHLHHHHLACHHHLLPLCELAH
jgi:hypothetical protein